MARCTWDPTSKEDRCKCHYCADRKNSKKPGPITTWAEILLLVKLLTEYFNGSNNKPTITSPVFRSLEYAYLLTFSCCVVSTCYLILGKNIFCTAAGLERDEMFIAQTYCLMAPTITLGNFTLTGESMIHPGVGLPAIQSGNSNAHEEVRHVYYQWVPYILLLQCFVLRLPWQSLLVSTKDGVFKALVGNLDKIELPPLLHKEDNAEPRSTKQGDAPLPEDEITNAYRRLGKRTPNTGFVAKHYQKECKKQAKIFKTSMGEHIHFLRVFIFSEMFGTAVALGNLFLTNIFLGNEFLRYGSEMMRHLWKRDIDAMDPSSIMNQVFPKMAKCTWRSFGSSGTIETKALLCVLPLNVVYEKAYMVLWVAYITIAVVTSLCLIYHFFLLIIPGSLDRRTLAYNESFKLSKEEYQSHARQVLDRCGRADKFILYNLKMHARDFSPYIKCLAEELAGNTCKQTHQLQPNAPLITGVEL